MKITDYERCDNDLSASYLSYVTRVTSKSSLHVRRFLPKSSLNHAISTILRSPLLLPCSMAVPYPGIMNIDESATQAASGWRRETVKDGASLSDWD